MKTVNEATNKKEEHTIPSPIKYNEKNGGVIVQIPTGLQGYTKLYFANESAAEQYDAARTSQDSSKNAPYRTKTIDLPVSREGKTFRYVDDLFRHLRKECGYKTL